MAAPTVDNDEDEPDDDPADAEEEVEETETEEETEEVETDGGDEPDDSDDEEEVEVEEAELPDDEGEDDDEDTGGSLLAGSTFGISNKALLAIGLLAVIAVVVLSNYDPDASSRKYEDDGAVQQEVEDGTDGTVEESVMDPGGSAGRFSEATQDDAIGSVFG